MKTTARTIAESLAKKLAPGSPSITEGEKERMRKQVQTLAESEQEWIGRVKSLQEEVDSLHEELETTHISKLPTVVASGGPMTGYVYVHPSGIDFAKLTEPQQDHLASICHLWLEESGMNKTGMPADYDDDLDSDAERELVLNPHSASGKIALVRKLGKWHQRRLKRLTTPMTPVTKPRVSPGTPMPAPEYHWKVPGGGYEVTWGSTTKTTNTVSNINIETMLPSPMSAEQARRIGEDITKALRSKPTRFRR